MDRRSNLSQWLTLSHAHSKGPGCHLRVFKSPISKIDQDSLQKTLCLVSQGKGMFPMSLWIDLRILIQSRRMGLSLIAQLGLIRKPWSSRFQLLHTSPLPCGYICIESTWLLHMSQTHALFFRNRDPLKSSSCPYSLSYRVARFLSCQET